MEIHHRTSIEDIGNENYTIMEINIVVPIVLGREILELLNEYRKNLRKLRHRDKMREHHQLARKFYATHPYMSYGMCRGAVVEMK